MNFDALLIQDNFRPFFDRIKIFRCKDYIDPFFNVHLPCYLNLNERDNLNLTAYE
jgi:hypothetical protein